jgi:hypothetical protein
VLATGRGLRCGEKRESRVSTTQTKQIIVEMREDRSIALLCFTTVNGLLSFVAAMFTNLLPLSVAWRYFWLIICIATFGLALTGIVLFSRSYSLPTRIQQKPQGPAGS